ncbi:MAG: hypothetical protein ABIQ30_18385, partial [Devosia sp.]
MPDGAAIFAALSDACNRADGSGTARHKRRPGGNDETGGRLMNFGSAEWLALGEIIWINALLSGDNAVVIAMACRSLPATQRKVGMVAGAGVA